MSSLLGVRPSNVYWANLHTPMKPRLPGGQGSKINLA
jgi:hypothetical protein